MAMRTIKSIDSPGRFTLEEAYEAARSLQKAPAKKATMTKKAASQKPSAKKPAAKSSQ
jgi:hypothetical protein